VLLTNVKKIAADVSSTQSYKEKKAKNYSDYVPEAFVSELRKIYMYHNLLEDMCP